MKAEGADYDIHLVWNIKELINKVGPEKAIRELKKRCEAGAIIGCTIYKRQIEHWLQVAMRFEDRAGRGPAEDFMAAAGEDEWVRRVEKLHEEHPAGIPRSIQLDLLDEFNADLERKVGRNIPLEPGDASEEDIKESKRIAGQMARHEKVTPPKKEKETPPPPPKEKEKPRPEPVRAAPEEPVIPVPKKPGGKAPELDLMKQEIEERIARMRAEKARGELKAGESSGDPLKEERIRLAKMIATTYPAFGDFVGLLPGLESVEDLEELYGWVGASDIPDSDKETLRNMIRTHIDKVKRLYTEKGRGELKAGEPIMPIFVPIKKEKRPQEERIELAKKIAYGEIGVREGVDILTEPKDYSQWTFADYEGLLPGLESVEDLEELYEQVGASEVIADSDKEAVRNMIKARIDVVKRLYTEWAAREDK